MPNTKLRDESVLWTVYSEAKAETEIEDLSYHQARSRVVAAMARAYKLEPREIHQHSETNLYPNVSKITRLIFPKHADAATNLERELKRGNLAFNSAVEIARGNARTREDCRKALPGAKTTTSGSIDLSTLFSGVIAAAVQAGYTPERIATAFQDVFDETDTNEA